MERRPADKVNKPVRGYFSASRNPWFSLAVSVPLLLLYNIGLLMPGNTTGNAVDLLSRLVLPFIGLRGFLVVNAVLVLGSIVLMAVLIKRKQFRPLYYFLLCVEGLVWGLVIGFGVTLLLKHASIGLGTIGHMSVPQAISCAAGAGYWEELVFRLLLVGVPISLVSRVGKASGARVAIVTAVAILLSSLAFSLAHYIGQTETPDAYSFLYRALSGAVFAAIFLWRGFGVAAYSHFLYDVWVMVY